MQPGACEIAWAAEAANRQRSFWPFHDALFAADARDPASGIADAARSVRLDAARFASDRRSDSTLARVATDIALGDRLQIPGTPAVFVDGRLVPSTDHRVLETLIRHVLGEPPAGQPRSSPDVVGTDRPAIRGRSSRGG
jgi:protein-disulfide isomerase